jgi:threonyl-tRNA synthetase
MTPVQAIILPINDSLVSYAEEIRTVFIKAGLRVELDGRTESLNKKVREAQINKIPLIITIGKKEKDAGSLSVRTLDGNVRYGVKIDDFLKRTLECIKKRELDPQVF